MMGRGVWSVASVIDIRAKRVGAGKWQLWMGESGVGKRPPHGGIPVSRRVL
jgi:hypothetical protein